MVRVQLVSEDKNFVVRIYAGLDVVLICWNVRDVEGFLGVKIRRTCVSNGTVVVLGDDKPLFQRFNWSDYTAKPGETYKYEVLAYFGTDENKERYRLSTSIDMEVNKRKHRVYFNRGVAGSQAFSKLQPQLDEGNVESLDGLQRVWLSNGLEEAMFSFVRQACSPQYSLFVCAYEFKHDAFLKVLADAHEKGAQVRVVLHWKSSTSKNQGEEELLKQEAKESDEAMKRVNFPQVCVIRRRSNTSSISHNKFMVLEKDGIPVSLWTGSANYTPGGIFGQLNACHWIEDAGVAATYKKYWEIMARDPALAQAKQDVEKLNPLPTLFRRNEMVPVFSPRSSEDLLYLQTMLVSKAKESSFVTAAFGVNPLLQTAFTNNSSKEHFLLLESLTGLPESFVNLPHLESRIAFGALINADVASKLGMLEEKLSGLNDHVKYVHTKLLLVDMFSENPICMFGSGNMSKSSVTSNDENLIFVFGDTDVADQILCHLFRVFQHFLWRLKVKSDPPSKPFPKRKSSKWYLSHYEANSEKSRKRNLMCPLDSAKQDAPVAVFDLPVEDFKKNFQVVAKEPPRRIKFNADLKRFFLEFPFNATLKDEVKAVDGSKWHADAKSWSLPEAARQWLEEFALKYGFVFL